MGDSPRADQSRLWESSSWCGRLTDAKRRRQGLGLPRGIALRGPSQCAPRCRARTLLWCCCARVVDLAAVGEFGLAPSASRPTVRYA